MARKYDLAFSLGAACSCTECLRQAGLQFASYPFDWLFGSDLQGRTDVLCDGFPGWLEKADLESCPSPDWHDKAIYRNRRTGIVFNHDFPKGVPLEESFPEVARKYRRRIERLLREIGESERVLALWVGTPKSAEVGTLEAESCLASLRRRFPNVMFELLAFNCIAGVAQESRRTERGRGFEIIGFDYKTRDTNPKYAYLIEKDLIIRRLRDRGIRAKDRRTPGERRKHARREREREYARFGATGLLSYLIAKTGYKIRRHLQKVWDQKRSGSEG